MPFLVPILFEILSVNVRPCFPNVGFPLKQVAVGVTLKSIRRELVLHKMLAHCLKWHVQSSNIYIEVAPTAENKLFHNLICVSDCEVARNGMNHLRKGGFLLP